MADKKDSGLTRWVRDIDGKVDKVLLQNAEVMQSVKHICRRIDDHHTQIKRHSKDVKKLQKFQSKIKGEVSMFRIMLVALGVFATVGMVIVMLVK